jgi:hypothetical protein
MADPPSGDPGGDPTNSDRIMRLSRPQRSPSPPAFRRVTRAYKRKRNSLTAITENNRTPSFDFSGSSEERGTNYDEVAWLIADLKKTIIDQNHTIEKVTAELTEIKSEQASLAAQNIDLQNEIRSLRNQLSTYSENPPSSRSWASVVANGNATSTETSLSKSPSNGSLKREPNCLRISTPPRPIDSEDLNPAFTRYLPISIANSYIRDALKNSSATGNVQVAGVGTTKTGYIIRFKDSNSADAAQSTTEWLDKLGNGTKLVKPLFGIVVHRVPTANFSIPGNEPEGIQRIMADNDLASKGFQIDKIAWLKKPTKPLGMHASMGIWLNTPEAAEWIVNNGLLIGQQYIGSIEHYQLKGKRCHRCQRFGHLAWSCKERARCGHCAGEHERRNCPTETRARCLECYGPHPTGDRDCQMEHGPLSGQ